MTEDDIEDVATAIEFLVHLGAELIRSGTAVNHVQERLLTVARQLGLPATEIVVLPTAVLIQTRDGSVTKSILRSFHRSPLRLDQIGDIDTVGRRAELGSIGAADGLRTLDEISGAPPPHRRAVRIAGMGVLSAGFALLLQPTAGSIGVAFALGLAVGALRVLELPQFQAVLPVLAAFGVSVAVFSITSRYGIDNPIRMLIPPLVLFLPGSALTTGTMELAAGETVSGASRLVEGVVNLLLLAFGIVAAAAMVHLPDAELVDRPVIVLGWVAPVLGLVVITIGQYLHNCAPRRAVPWVFLVTCVAFAGQAAGAALVSPELSGFFGALAMTPVIFWLSRRPWGPPEMTLFLPAFWVLVPGATGLIGVTEAVGAGGLGAGGFGDTAVTVASITLGILLGAATWDATTDATRRARQLLVDRTALRPPRP